MALPFLSRCRAPGKGRGVSKALCCPWVSILLAGVRGSQHGDGKGLGSRVRPRALPAPLARWPGWLGDRGTPLGTNWGSGGWP